MLLVVTKIEYSTIHNTTPYTEETQDSGGGGGEQIQECFHPPLPRFLLYMF